MSAGISVLGLLYLYTLMPMLIHSNQLLVSKMQPNIYRPIIITTIFNSKISNSLLDTVLLLLIGSFITLYCSKFRQLYIFIFAWNITKAKHISQHI